MSGKSLMHGQGECVVPTKQPNKGGEPPAEAAEGRPLTKENTLQPNPCRTPSRENRAKWAGVCAPGRTEGGEQPRPSARFDAKHLLDPR